MGPVSIVVPPGLRRALEDEHAGRVWLASLDELAARAVRRWGLVLGEPFQTGMAAWTAPATTEAGLDVVLKLSFPHLEARDEAAALAAWRGAGAVELLGAAPEDQALLLRRMRPGTDLTDAGLPIADHLAVGAELLRRMATVDVPSGAPFQDLVSVASDRADTAEQRIAETIPLAPYPVDLGLCRRAVDLLRSLPAGAERVGLAHGDLNPGNILRQQPAPSAEDGPVDGWVAIDPKPVHGDLAFDPWPLLTQVGGWVETTPTAADLADRTRLVADVTALDAGRMAAWCTARSVESGLWAASRGWWTGFRGADGDFDRARAWAGAANHLGG
ncbi:aminoglycoside phosphotransferase family protein [soil metagenome]